MTTVGGPAGRREVWLIADGPDPDNYVAALALASSAFGLNVGGVIMTGRPVNSDHSAKPYEADKAASETVRFGSAVRMKDLLVRYGRGDIPVFEGSIAPYSTIPHRIHIDERVLDIVPPLPASRLAGGINDAIAQIASLPADVQVDLVCAGPLTDAAKLMKDPRVRDKLGILTAQMGMFGSDRVQMMSGGRRQFNVLADSNAAREVIANYPGAVYMVPTDITKLPEFSFSGPEDLATLAKSPASDHIAAMYERAWPIIWEPRSERIYVHDFHPVEVMANLTDPARLAEQASSLGSQQVGRYELSRVSVDHVPSPGPGNDRREEGRWGEIDLKSTVDPNGPPRFLATNVNADPALHREILSEVLNAPASQEAAASHPPARHKDLSRVLNAPATQGAASKPPVNRPLPASTERTRRTGGTPGTGPVRKG